VEYDLKFEPLKAMKGQVVANFIVDHSVNTDEIVCVAKDAPWKLFFDGSVCSHGQGVECVLVSPHSLEYEVTIQLEFGC
jgi:hypothetical protein